MEIILNNKAKEVIETLGNKTARMAGLKIYTALYNKSKYKNGDGYFSVPSRYLIKVNRRYNKVINTFIEHNIIEYYKRIEYGLFENREIKFYDSTNGICMKYRFLIDIEDGEKIEVDFKSPYKTKWFDRVKTSLEKLGYEPIIKRDGFGLRVWHSAIPTYKKDLVGKNLAVIDAKCSQPKLLYLLMKGKNVSDKNYMDIFENGRDFYNFIVKNLNLNNRQEAKDLFMFWVNSQGYVPNFRIHTLFPEASKFIKKLKSNAYKDSASFLQREEAKIWIDDLLENLPSDFGLPVHDSLIVRATEVEDICEWCRSKYPQIDFDIKYL